MALHPLIRTQRKTAILRVGRPPRASTLAALAAGAADRKLEKLEARAPEAPPRFRPAGYGRIIPLERPCGRRAAARALNRQPAMLCLRFRADSGCGPQKPARDYRGRMRRSATARTMYTGLVHRLELAAAPSCRAPRDGSVLATPGLQSLPPGCRPALRPNRALAAAPGACVAGVGPLDPLGAPGAAAGAAAGAWLSPAL